MGFRRYVIKRALYSFFLIFAIIAFVFILFRILPGDPALLIGLQSELEDYQIQELRVMFGIDRPVWEQFFLFIRNVFRGDLGYSFISRRPVSVEIMERLPNTLLLIGLGISLAFFLGIVGGLFSASWVGRKRDLSALAASLLLYSVPGFWLGITFLVIFGAQLPLFPLGGTTSRPPPDGFFNAAVDVLHHAFLPVAAMALHALGGYLLIMRSTVLDELTQDYVVTAKAKGLTEREVLFGHVMRNAMLPMITSVAISFAHLLTGTVTIETVFSWHGLGRYIYQSVYSLDYPVLQAIFLLVAIYVVLSNFFVDVVYGFLDPRVRLGRE